MIRVVPVDEDVHPRVDADELEARFKPLRPASRPSLVLASALGSLAWLLAFALVALLVRFTLQIAFGLLVTGASLLVSAIVLVLLRRGRNHEERRYVDPT